MSIDSPVPALSALCPHRQWCMWLRKNGKETSSWDGTLLASVKGSTMFLSSLLGGRVMGGSDPFADLSNQLRSCATGEATGDAL